MAAAVIPWLQIATTAIPEVAALVQSVLALRKKYPALTPDQITAIVAQTAAPADAEFDAVLAKIAADQKVPGA
jgi:hypothetical protein